LAHQAADTLKTIVTDKDLILRIIPHINDLVRFVIACFETNINIPTFFEFVDEIVKFYQTYVDIGLLMQLLQVIVKRLVFESESCI